MTKTMTSRERVRAAINHIQPDRVPIDLGSTAVSGISAVALQHLRHALGLEKRPVKVHEPFQILGQVEEDVRKALGVDVVGLWNPQTMFGFKNEGWKNWTFKEGYEFLVPDRFNLTSDRENNRYMHPNGDVSVPPSAKLPSGGYYFDNITRQEPIVESALNARTDFKDDFGLYTDDLLRYFEEKSKYYYEHTDYAINLQAMSGNFGDPAPLPAPNQVNPKGIRSFDEWLMYHYLNPNYIKEVFEMQAEIGIKNMKLLKEAVGDRVDIIQISATDFGTQRSEIMSPDLYREIYKPFHKQMNDWVHENTNWKTFFHCCGSIVNLLDDFVEIGVDILNPVQCSAEGMDPEFLKNKYGKDLVFWGGSINTQQTLPFGTPEDVIKEAQSRIDILGKDGGFVYNAIHNIQSITPVENIVAFFETARKYKGK